MNDRYWDGENWLKVVKSYGLIRYYLGVNLHRNDGPAFIIEYEFSGTENEKFPNTKIRRDIGCPGTIAYYKNGNAHRSNDLPAEFTYYASGQISSIKYWYNGNLHRINGPAIYWYDENGKLLYENYWINGIKIDPEKFPFELPIDSPEKRFMLQLKYGIKND